MSFNLPFHKGILEKLEPAEKRYCIKDNQVSGLQLLVHPTGVKTFILLRKINGQSQRIKIGRFNHISIENARKLAKNLNSEITRGVDPQKEKKEKKNALTFQQLYDIYYDQHALKNTKRPKENKNTMELHVLPIFGKSIASEISSQDMKSYFTKLVGKEYKRSKNGKIKKTREGTAKRVINIVSAVFNYGIDEEYIKCTNPCKSIKRPSSISRDRFLSFEEIKKFFDALSFEDKIYQDVFKILLYTGARKSNVLQMKWSEIDLSIKRWRLPETKTKNKDVNIVSLSDFALEILEKRKTDNDALAIPSLYVFPGSGVDGHLVDIKKSFNRIKKRMDVYDIVVHDLRRTLGSYMAINGTSLTIIGKTLNHKSQISTAIYARLSQDPILDSMNSAIKLMNV